MRLLLAYEAGTSEAVINKKLRVCKTATPGRLVVREALEYANRMWGLLPDENGDEDEGMVVPPVVIFANFDITFDISLRLLHQDQRLRGASPPSSSSSSSSEQGQRYVYFLSRYEVAPSTRRPSMCSRHYQGSHDALVFVPPLPESLLPHTEVPIGAVGYENLLIYEFERAGFAVTNPCLSVRSFHRHDSGIKSQGNTARVNIDGRTAYARPGFHHLDGGNFLKDPQHFLDFRDIAAILRKKGPQDLCPVPVPLLPLVLGFCHPGEAFREGVYAWNCTHLPCEVLQQQRPKGIQCSSRSILYACKRHTTFASLFEDHHHGFGIRFDGRFRVAPSFFEALEVMAGRRSDSPWIYTFLGESLGNHPEAGDPSILARFNWTVGYQPGTFNEQIVPFLNATLADFVNPPPRLEHKGAPVLMLISNCHDTNNRLDYARELMKEIDVDSFGACLRNRNISEVIPAGPGIGRREEKAYLLRQYPFVISFENSNEPDYITEKLWEQLRYGSIPLYYGAPNVEEYLPGPYSIIEAEKYHPKDLARLLKDILQDETLYRSFFAWRDNPSSKFKKMLRASTEFVEPENCGVCQRMWDFRVENL